MYFVIDIGASKTLFALFSRRGKLLKTKKFPTESSETIYLEYFSENLRSFFDPKTQAKVEAVVVAIPGTVKELPDPKNPEQIFYSFSYGNLSWKKLDLLPSIKNLFNCKIFFLNDANLATLYEASFYKNQKVTYLTFSTGIGGGIAKDKKLLEESKNFEPGHAKYRFKDIVEEWEDIASAKAISNFYSGAPVKNLRHNKSALREIAIRLSLGLPDVLLETDPDVLVIGGAVGFIIEKCKKLLIPLVKLALEAQISRANAPKAQKTSVSAAELINRIDTLKIVPARRPTESVIYGGYLYAKENA